MQINNRVYSVGVLNPALRVFDIIMATGYGTSYNAYLLKGTEKTALIDASHESFKETFVRNIEAYESIEKIDYLIINHTEPDHSGAVAYLLERNPEITIYGTSATIKNLEAITQRAFKHVVVTDGETLSLGDMTLTFLVSPNIHWPDTMMTWLEEDRLLFSCDFLGAHYAEPTMFLKTSNRKELYQVEFENYYNAIMGPFSGFVQKALKKIKDLDIDMVCPSHGPILAQGEVAEATALYDAWSKPKEKEKKSVAIYYVSAYGYTRRMANHLKEKLEAEGVDVFCGDVIKTSPEEISEHLEDDALIFGSPTINRAALKPIWDVISSIDAVTAQGKPYATFGCYGWSGEACGQLNDRLNGIKMKPVDESVRSRFAPTEDTYRELDAMAKKVAEVLKK